MTIKIKNLRVRTIIGVFELEREETQDVVINATIDFDGYKAAQSDDIQDTLDYKALTKKIINSVESSQFYLLEKLADTILQIIMDHSLVKQAEVEVDKPQALRFSDSVSVSCSATRKEQSA